MTIYPHKSYLRALKKLSIADQDEVNSAIERLPAVIGSPHQHSGAGVRRLCPGVFEIRAGLQLRVVFTIRAETIFLHTVGDHNQVKNWLKNNL